MSRLFALAGELTSSKQTARKKAVVEITDLLEQHEQRARLCDREWLTLVKAAVHAAKLEMAVASKASRAPRVEYADFVERVASWADGSGGRRLARCAKPLATHVVDALAGGEALVLEGYGAPYARLLERLLGEAEYVAAGSPRRDRKSVV